MDPRKYHRLKEALSAVEQADYPVNSRFHALHSFEKDCFVKRDDELGFGLSGSKIRKFRTLLPWLIRQGAEEAVVIGTPHSNNVLSLVQLLIENGISPILFLRGESRIDLKGNLLMTRLLTMPKSIKWIPRHLWVDVETLAHDYAKEQLERDRMAVVISEGSSMPASFPGAMTLALDILRNEEGTGITFDHLFMDAGTGLMAAATLLAFAWMEKPINVHIILMAGNLEQFDKNLAYYHGVFEKWIGDKVPFPKNYQLMFSETSSAFGSVNKNVLEMIRFMALEEGILTDPIYSAKLFYTVKHLMRNQEFRGNKLIVHSGGGTSLWGYHERLQQIIREAENGSCL